MGEKGGDFIIIAHENQKVRVKTAEMKEFRPK